MTQDPAVMIPSLPFVPPHDRRRAVMLFLIAITILAPMDVMTKLVGPTPRSLIFVPAAPRGSSRQFAEDRVCGSHRGCGQVPTSP